MSGDNWERRILQSYGATFRLDIQNPQTTVGGSDVYNFYSVTDDNSTCLFGHQQDGKFRVYNMGPVEIVGGEKSSQSGIDVVIAGMNGDVVINAEKNGRVRIRAKNIVLQADEDVDISGGRNVNIRSGSGRVLLEGNVLEKTGLKGNVLDPEQQWAYRVFENTGLPAANFFSLLEPFSGILNIVPGIIANPASLTGFIDGAISNAVSSATGGLVGGLSGGLGGIAGGIAEGALGGLTGGLGGIADGALGGLTDGLGGIAGDALGGLTGEIGGIAGDALGGLTGEIGGIAGDALGGITGGLDSTISNIVSSATDGLVDGIGGIGGDIVGDVANIATDSVSNLSEQIVSPLTSKIPIQDLPTLELD